MCNAIARAGFAHNRGFDAREDDASTVPGTDWQDPQQEKAEMGTEERR